jgi:hypothetical protein
MIDPLGGRNQDFLIGRTGYSRPAIHLVRTRRDHPVLKVTCGKGHIGFLLDFENRFCN